MCSLKILIELFTCGYEILYWTTGPVEFPQKLARNAKFFNKKTSMGLAALIENMRRSKLGKKGTENRSTARTTEV